MNAVLSMLTGKEVNDIGSVLYQGFNPYNTGCKIKTGKVFSICNGTILALGQDPKNDTWTLTVEVNSQKWIRYCGLLSLKITIGQEIHKSDYIGLTDEGVMRLEYCNSVKSDYPVRECNRQLYKHDPTPIIFSSGE